MTAAPSFGLHSAYVEVAYFYSARSINNMVLHCFWFTLSLLLQLRAAGLFSALKHGWLEHPRGSWHRQISTEIAEGNCQAQSHKHPNHQRLAACLTQQTLNERNQNFRTPQVGQTAATHVQQKQCTACPTAAESTTEAVYPVANVLRPVITGWVSGFKVLTKLKTKNL